MPPDKHIARCLTTIKPRSRSTLWSRQFLHNKALNISIRPRGQPAHMQLVNRVMPAAELTCTPLPLQTANFGIMLDMPRLGSDLPSNRKAGLTMEL